MTRDTIEKLPTHIRDKIEALREDYTQYKEYTESDYDANVDIGLKQLAEVKILARGYLMGLLHACVITERERQILFCYVTTPKVKKEG